MRNIVSKTLMVTGLLTTSVFADTTASAPSKTSFSGFYMGANTGGTMNVVKPGDKKNPFNKTDFSKISPVFGFNLGYLAQLAQYFLLGGEALIEYGKSDITLVDGEVDKEIPANVLGHFVGEIYPINYNIKQKQKIQVRQTWKAQLALVAAYQVAYNTLLYCKFGMQYNPGIQFSHKADKVNERLNTRIIGSIVHTGLPAQDISGKTSMWNPFIGIGAKLALTQNVAINAEYTYAFPKEVKFKKDKKEIGKAKINNHTFRLGLQYKF